MVYVIMIGSLFLCEWFMKNMAEAWGKENVQKDIVGGKLYLTKYHNEGAFLNLGEKKRKLMALISIILTVFCLMLFLLSFFQKGNNLLKAGLSLLLGGAFSNTYDRIKRKYVVDYFGFRFKRFPGISKVVFNLSDFFIVAGALIAALAGMK
ncbi:MAG: signal peptidase II [Lachnospiraceae bacterium]|nr:signal peptidase II [Lachnospiraceae bacterium]